VTRLRQAIAAAAQQAREKAVAGSEKLGRQYGAIFAAHARLTEDAALAQEIEGLILEQGYAAEYAVSRVMRRHAKALESLDRGHFAARAADLFDIEKALLSSLLCHRREQMQQLTEQVKLLAQSQQTSTHAMLGLLQV